ncbi:MAG: hypothetical protein KC561_00290 [Myxococcales bacterium]|nr:hypothetical protein [Myxococcales bacterium]
MDLVELIESRRFLGSEFLVWLWYRCDNGEARFEIPDFETVTLEFDDQLVLEGFLAESEQSRLKGGAPSHSPEAQAALKAGKRPSRAKLRLLQGDREWVFSVNAHDFAFSSVKVPAVLKEEDERILERVSLVDELCDMWDGLYKLFLERRLGEQWPETVERMSAWITEGLAAHS